MRNLKKVLLSLGAVAAIAALATGGTFAVFTDSDSVADNDIDSGSVSIALGGDDPVIEVADMVIDDTKSGELTITNDGDNKATYTLTGDYTAVDDPDGYLEDAVRITIHDEDTDTDVVNDVTLAAFNAGSGVSFDLSPAGVKTYTVSVELAGIADHAITGVTNDNQLQDLALEEEFDVDAVQRAGVDRDVDTTPED